MEVHQPKLRPGEQFYQEAELESSTAARSSATARDAEVRQRALGNRCDASDTEAELESCTTPSNARDVGNALGNCCDSTDTESEFLPCTDHGPPADDSASLSSGFCAQWTAIPMPVDETDVKSSEASHQEVSKSSGSTEGSEQVKRMRFAPSVRFQVPEGSNCSMEGSRRRRKWLEGSTCSLCKLERKTFEVNGMPERSLEGPFTEPSSWCQTCQKWMREGDVSPYKIYADELGGGSC